LPPSQSRQDRIAKSESGLEDTLECVLGNGKDSQTQNFHPPSPFNALYSHAHSKSVVKAVEMSVVATGNQPNADEIDKGSCKYCESNDLVKWGRQNGHQRHRCKNCNHIFDDNGRLPRMRNETKVIATAIDLYFEGLSLRKVQRHLKKIHGVEIGFRRILAWIEKYSGLVGDFTRSIEPPNLSRNWQTDETMLRMEGDWKWLWEAIDEDTRFLVATHVSEGREKADVVRFLRSYPWTENQKPKVITTDGLQSYRKGINKAFYSHYKDRRTIHRRSPGLKTRQGNTNMVERIHGTLKDRFKSLRGFKKMDTAVLKAWPIHYNYLRPHSSLGGQTPAEASGVHLPFEDGWGDLIRWATVWKNQSEN